MDPIRPTVELATFEKLDIRAGRVVDVQPFPEGRFSTHVLQIDFGPEIGTRKSLARLAPRYAGPELVGRMVLAVVNFAPRQIGRHRSEVLTLGVPGADGSVVLVQPEVEVLPGARLY